jgi:hypothetical protein
LKLLRYSDGQNNPIETTEKQSQSGYHQLSFPRQPASSQRLHFITTTAQQIDINKVKHMSQNTAVSHNFNESDPLLPSNAKTTVFVKQTVNLVPFFVLWGRAGSSMSSFSTLFIKFSCFSVCVCDLFPIVLALSVKMCTTEYLVVVCEGKGTDKASVVLKTPLLEDAKAYLMNTCPDPKFPERMVCMALDGHVVQDPHKIGIPGQRQAQGMAAGFNKFWWGWPSIYAMNTVAQQVMDVTPRLESVVALVAEEIVRRANFNTNLCVPANYTAGILARGDVAYFPLRDLRNPQNDVILRASQGIPDGFYRQSGRYFDTTLLEAGCFVFVGQGGSKVTVDPTKPPQFTDLTSLKA